MSMKRLFMIVLVLEHEIMLILPRLFKLSRVKCPALSDGLATFILFHVLLHDSDNSDNLENIRRLQHRGRP
jgi:hypothetical protein